MKFNPTKPVQTVAGKKVRILCTDCNSKSYPIVALVERGQGDEIVRIFSAEGKYSATRSGQGPRDLMNVPETGYVNIWQKNDGSMGISHDPTKTLEQAKDVAKGSGHNLSGGGRYVSIGVEVTVRNDI